MSEFFPTGMQGLNKAVPSASPIIVAAIPAINGQGGVVILPGPFAAFTQQFPAVAVGASVTLIQASIGLRWYLLLFRVFISATGIFSVQDNGVDIGLFTLPLNTMLAPFGDMPSGIQSINANTALTIKNTSAAICTYNVTLFGGYTQ